jgi:hypothetical protein
MDAYWTPHGIPAYRDEVRCAFAQAFQIIAGIAPCTPVS